MQPVSGGVLGQDEYCRLLREVWGISDDPEPLDDDGVVVIL